MPPNHHIVASQRSSPPTPAPVPPPASDSDGTDSRQVAWYVPGPPQLPENMKSLLQSWSGLDSADRGIEKHAHDLVRWVARVYKTGQCLHVCIGGYRFLGLGLVAHPSFNAVVSTLKAPAVPAPLYLDIGCCVGQDLRSLAAAGVPGTQLIGVDLEGAFIDIGYELFRDRSKLGARFYVADILSLDEPTPEPAIPHVFAPLIGSVSIIWAAAFLHLWDLAGQIAVCRKMVLLLRDAPGARILGRQVGSHYPGEIRHVTNKGGLMYKHNPESFKAMWCQVLGVERPVAEGKTLVSKKHGSWELRAWFENDAPSPQGTGQETDIDWLTKVSVESSGALQTGAQEEDVMQRTKSYFMVWELERVG